MDETLTIVLTILILLPTTTGDDAVSSVTNNFTTDFITERTLNNDEKIVADDLLLLLTLQNLTKAELQSLFDDIKNHNYARLFEVIEEKKQEVAEFYETYLDMDDSKSTKLNKLATNLASKKAKIIEAYQNASIYRMIRALWNAKTTNILPIIDQIALLDYFNEKLIEEGKNENFFIRVWNIIKSLFRREKEEIGCYANEPECIRALLKALSKNERIAMENALETENLSTLSDIIKIKSNDLSNISDEYNKWEDENDVPNGLKTIVQNISQAQKRAIQKLRRFDLRTKLKDYYRGRIEKLDIKTQQEIEKFVERMNRTFARCYNPTNIHGYKRMTQDL